MLDLWQQDGAISARPQQSEGTELPAGFGDTFDAAWHQGQLFSSSVAQGNAQMAAMEGYVNDVKKISGVDIKPEVYPQEDMQTAAQQAVAKIRQQRPELQIPELTDDEWNKRTVAVSAQAQQAGQAMAAREKTLGGKIGAFAGGLVSGSLDPFNLVGLAIAPEADLSVAGSALLWGAYGAGSQAVNEVMNAPFREQAQPGYIESGAPGMNVVESTIGGAVLGGGFKAVGNLWTRSKTGEWPRSVRDSGNVVESEANVQQSNVLPGAEGEATHRQALSSAIDQILNGHGVDVGTMEASRDLVSRLQPEPAFRLPVINEQAIRLISEEAGLNQRSVNIGNQIAGLRYGDPSALDRLTRLQAVEDQIANTTDRTQLRALNERRDQILVDTTPEQLRTEAEPFEQRRALQAEHENIAARLTDIQQQRAAIPQQDPAMLGQTSPVRSLFDVHEGRIDSLMEMRAKALQMGTDAAEQRAQAMGQGELPLVASTMDRVHDIHVNAMAKGIQQLAKYAAHDMPADEALTLAERIARSGSDDEARAILNEIPLRPRTLADTLPSVAAIARAQRAEARAALSTAARAQLTPDAMARTLADPAHATAMMTDLERIRDQGTGPQMIPVGVDDKGEPQFKLLDAAIQEAKNDEEAAAQLEACVNPPKEETEQ